MSAFTHIRKDAQAEEIIIERIDEDGAPLLSSDGNYKGSIQLSLDGYGGVPTGSSATDLGCKGSDGNYHAVYLQETEICVGGVVKRCITLRSDPFDPPA
jgi:hypothetical protein